MTVVSGLAQLKRLLFDADLKPSPIRMRRLLMLGVNLTANHEQKVDLIDAAVFGNEIENWSMRDTAPGRANVPARRQVPSTPNRTGTRRSFSNTYSKSPYGYEFQWLILRPASRLQRSGRHLQTLDERCNGRFSGNLQEPRGAA